MCESLSRCSAAGVSRCRVGDGRERAVGWGMGARDQSHTQRLNTVYSLTLASGSVFNQMKNKYLNKI